MTARPRVPIPATHRDNWPDTTPSGAIASKQDVLLTMWLRPKKGGDLDDARALALGSTPPLERRYADRKALAAATGASDEDLAAIRKYCSELRVDVVESHWRSLVLSAPLDRLIEAFGATVVTVAAGDGASFRHRSGALHADQPIADVVRGVFGLHQWPRARRLGPLQRHEMPLLAKDVAARYAFPDGDGSGQTIGIVQLGGQFKPGDFDLCMRAQGVSPGRPIVKRVDDAAIAHKADTDKDLEAALDAQVIGSLAPGARVVLYEAPNDERGFLDAIRTALFDEEFRPSILSISYGWPEFLWTPAALDVLDELFTVAAFLGVSVFCASGDNGAELDWDGKPHVLAPASCAFVHACGATTITATRGAAVEAAWEKTGGGFSKRVAPAPWQSHAKTVAAAQGVRAGRGVPDVAAQQDPGYCVYLDGVALTAGGTSSVAPMWAALTARINQRIGAQAGFFAPLLYASHEKAMRPIAKGDNGRYRAGAPWNPCTGLGVPIGSEIETALRS